MHYHRTPVGSRLSIVKESSTPLINPGTGINQETTPPESPRTRSRASPLAPGPATGQPLVDEQYGQLNDLSK